MGHVLIQRDADGRIQYQKTDLSNEQAIGMMEAFKHRLLSDISWENSKSATKSPNTRSVKLKRSHHVRSN